MVARSQPDGYTLLLANPSLAISPTLYQKLNYRPIEDFAYVGRYGSVPNVLVVRPSVPATTAQDPKLREILEARGFVVVQGTPGDFTNFIKSETAKFAPVIKRAGVVVE